MPRKIGHSTPLDDCEDEVIYTRSALKADPDASDLLAVTDGWMALVDATRAKDRGARIAVGEANAARTVSNGRLDDECKAFGDNLNLEVKKDRSSARWKRFFMHTVSDFVRQRLETQVNNVRGWLVVTDDAVFERHRSGLERWSTAAQAALDQTSASAQVRGVAHIARESLGDGLTRERDGLEAQLVARARERSLGREWPSRFFRLTPRAAPPAEDPTDGPEVTLPSGG